METKKKKRLLNGIMVLLILVIAASGLFTVGKVQGWFEDPEEAVFISGSIRGIANIERNGIGYALKSDTILLQNDKLETKKGAEAELLWKESASFVLNESTELSLEACGEEKLLLELHQGEIFGDTLKESKSLEVTFEKNRAVLSDSVFSLSAQSGSCTLNLYAGDISVYLSDGTQERVEAGEVLSVVYGEDGTLSYEIGKLQIASLNEFLIQTAQSCDSADSLCFTSVQLQTVVEAREAEKKAALEESLKGAQISKTEEREEQSGTETDAEKDSIKNESEGSAEEYEGSDHTYEEENTYQPEENSSFAEESREGKICTITILCDTILDNLEELDNGKEAYVPANGTILATSTVEFEDGDTVFDVLKLVCDYAGIQLEYSWSPVYNSYYIEGINNLYEFDCGNESGWMYKVNGWFPNYGCSSYSLEDGDTIVWCYTCKGLGADVGGPTF